MFSAFSADVNAAVWLQARNQFFAYFFTQLTARCWVAREDEPFVKAELLLSARMLAADPKAKLPPYAPTRRNSKAKEPPEHGLALLRRRRRPEV